MVRGVYLPQLFAPEPEVVGQHPEGGQHGAEFTTARQANEGQDIQGVNWVHITRQRQREDRVRSYHNFRSVPVQASHTAHVQSQVTTCQSTARVFDFRLNTRAVRPAFTHFQLRHLVCCPSSFDVYVMSQFLGPEQYQFNGIVHWNAATQRIRPALDVSSEIAGRPVQLSTMAMREGLLVVGGFMGELVCLNLSTGVFYCNRRVAMNDNGITNAIELFDAPSGALRVAVCNNDELVRLFDVPSFAEATRFAFEVPINHTSPSPDGRLLCVVGDMQSGFVVDTRNGQSVVELSGHIDHSFASAWHPNGLHVATGNQDMTTRVFDLRKPYTAMAVLASRMAGVRSLQYNADGTLLGMSESADFMHVFDVAQDYRQKQEIDLFGEIAGFSFTPDSQALFVGVSHPQIGSLVEFSRHEHGQVVRDINAFHNTPISLR